MNQAIKKYFLRGLSFFLIYLLVIFQISFLGQIFPFSLTLNLLLILSFAILFVMGLSLSLWAAFFMGIIYDILTLGLVGRASVFYLAALLGFYLLRRFFSHSAPFQFSYFYLVSLFDRIFSAGRLDPVFFLQAFLDLFVLIFIIWLLRWLMYLFNPVSYIQLRFKEFR